MYVRLKTNPITFVLKTVFVLMQFRYIGLSKTFLFIVSDPMTHVKAYTIMVLINVP